MDFLTEPLAHGFVRRALLAGVAVAAAAGFLGTFVVQRGLAFLTDGLAHATFGGLALGLLLGASVEPSPWVALPFVVLVALGIGFVRRRSGLGADVATGVFFTLSFALGVVCLGLRSPAPPRWTWRACSSAASSRCPQGPSSPSSAATARHPGRAPAPLAPGSPTRPSIRSWPRSRGAGGPPRVRAHGPGGGGGGGGAPQRGGRPGERPRGPARGRRPSARPTPHRHRRALDRPRRGRHRRRGSALLPPEPGHGATIVVLLGAAFFLALVFRPALRV